MQSKVIGNTVLGLPILAYQWGSKGLHICIIGGVHGDEYEGVVASYGLIQALSQENPFRLRISIIPNLNLDGVLFNSRQNKNGIDLNRNLPTKDWTSEVLNPRYTPGPHANSEPENQALVRFIEEEKPERIFSLHSWKPVLNTNGDCKKEAEVIARHTGYEIQESIGYPTPGCLGTYTGLEKNIPTLTYEIERGLAPEKIIQIHVPAILDALKTLEES